MTMMRYVTHEYVCMYCGRTYGFDVVLQETDKEHVVHSNGVCQSDLEAIAQYGMEEVIKSIADRFR